MRMRTSLLTLLALIALSGCAGHEVGNGLSRFDSKSFWHSGNSVDDPAYDIWGGHAASE